MNSRNSFTEALREPDTGLVYRRRAHTGTATDRVLLLHGVGSNEENLMAVAAALPEELEVLLLRGPIQTCPQGFAWYQVTFTADGPSFRYEQTEQSRRLLCHFLQALPPLPSVIAGFSQGGIMSASVGLTEPELVKGFALLSGRILRELSDQVASPERLANTSAFIAHGRSDGVLPMAWAEEADTWLGRLGIARQTRYYDMGHEISAIELQDLSHWLTRTFMNGAHDHTRD